MKSSLKIVAQPAVLASGLPNPNAGLVFTPSRNAEKAAAGWGTMRVDATQNQQLESGIMVQNKRVAFVAIQKAVFESEGYVVNQTMPGLVVRILSYLPLHENDKKVVNSTTKETAKMFGRDYYARNKYIAEPKPGTELNDFSLMKAQAQAEIDAAANVADDTTVDTETGELITSTSPATATA